MEVAEKLKEAIQLMRKDLREDRNLGYEEGSIGITTLLYCPLKADYRKLYPDIISEGNAIDDGYIFEKVVEPYIEKVFSGRVMKDPDIPYNLNGFKITGHPDFVIEDEDKAYIFELKAPIFIILNPKIAVPEDGFIIDTEKKIKISETYILQTKIQKLITEKYLKKPVEAFIFMKTLVQSGKKGKMHKVFVLRPVEDNITEEDVQKLIWKFENEKEPRYSWECDYCVYARKNICLKGVLRQKSKELSKW